MHAAFESLLLYTTFVHHACLLCSSWFPISQPAGALANRLGIASQRFNYFTLSIQFPSSFSAVLYVGSPCMPGPSLTAYATFTTSAIHEYSSPLQRFPGTTTGAKQLSKVPVQPSRWFSHFFYAVPSNSPKAPGSSSYCTTFDIPPFSTLIFLLTPGSSCTLTCPKPAHFLLQRFPVPSCVRELDFSSSCIPPQTGIPVPKTPGSSFCFYHFLPLVFSLLVPG